MIFRIQNSTHEGLKDVLHFCYGKSTTRKVLLVIERDMVAQVIGCKDVEI